jgi:hypothetical protein
VQVTVFFLCIGKCGIISIHNDIIDGGGMGGILH